MRILIVEDELHMAEALKANLEANHYEVDTAIDGQDGLDLALTAIYDLIVLDIMLPKMNGFEVLKEIRKAELATPVLLLTARTAIDDRVMGLDLGADDYLPKPFDTAEFLARVRALGRRKTSTLDGNILTFGDLTYEHQNLSLQANNISYTLTKKEGLLLELLIKAKGRIVEKELILDKLWGYEDGATDNNVEVYVSFLRKKLKALQVRTFVKTVRGVGYKLEIEE